MLPTGLPAYWASLDTGHQGTYAATKWQTPAAWKARIRGPLVAEWRVYADNEPIRAIMRQNAAH